MKKKGKIFVDPSSVDLKDAITIFVNRTAKVVKGGRKFHIGVMVVIGDMDGVVGFGYGKARDVQAARLKAVNDAKKNLRRFPLAGATIPHFSMGAWGSSKVKLIPASAGTGIISGNSVRAVLELVGVKNLLTKAYGSTKPMNLVKATIDALSHLRSNEQVERLRGVKIDESK